MNRPRRVIRQHGFTLAELMAVLIILGLLFTLAIRNIGPAADKARVATTKSNLRTLHQAAVEFKMDTARYPTQEAGLMELIQQPTDVTGWQTGGYLQMTQLPQDGWGRDFIYELYPESGMPFVIKSYGADGQPGGEGYDTDLLSTDAGRVGSDSPGAKTAP